MAVQFLKFMHFVETDTELFGGSTLTEKYFTLESIFCSAPTVLPVDR